MASLVYSSYLVNSFVEFIYCSPEDLFNHSLLISNHFVVHQNDGIPYIPGIKRQDLCIILFDKKNCEWTIHHCRNNTPLHIKYKFQSLAKKWIYLGILRDELVILQKFRRKIVYQKSNFHGSNKITLERCGNYSKSCTNSVKHIFNAKEYISKNSSYEIFQNILIFNISGGVTLVNSDQPFDLICFLLKNLTYTSHALFSDNYFQYLLSPVLKFRKWMDLTLNSPPLSKYELIHKKFIDNDEEYFSKKIKMFKNRILKIFTSIQEASPKDLKNFLFTFVDRLRWEICLEIESVYHRLRSYSHERKMVFKNFGNHPYIMLVKFIHQIYLESSPKKPIDQKRLIEIFFHPELTIYDRKMIMVIDAIRSRSMLFDPFYELYLDTKQKNLSPKYKLKYNYYPFRIFLSNLFIMEHLLNLPQSS